MDDQREMTLSDYGRVVWRRKWTVLAGVVAALFGALALTQLQDPIYEAEAQMLVTPRSGTAVFQQDATIGVANLDRTINTEIRVLEGQMVRQRVQDDFRLPNLPPAVNGTSIGSTDVVSVTVRSGDPATAQLLADAYVDAYISTRREQAVSQLVAAQAQLQLQIDNLQSSIDALPADSPLRPQRVNQLAGFQQRYDQMSVDIALTTGGASMVQAAELPVAPVEPQPMRTAMLAGVLGLLIGLAAAFVLDRLDDSVRGPDDLELLTDLPLLAVVPVSPPPDHRPLAITAPHEFAVEVYRGLRTSLLFLGLDRPLKIIQVTSSLPGEGKTTTAANLAVVLAQAGKQVALIDADLRKPRIHEVFGMPIKPGLTETLLSTDMVTMPLQHFGPLHVLAAGTLAPNPSEMLASNRFQRIVAALAERYDHVIIDSAPILPVSDSLALARVVDGVLLVTQSSRTTKRNVGEALSRLEKVGAPLVGMVLNRAAESATKGYGYGYSYGYLATGEIGASVDATATTTADADEATPRSILRRKTRTEAAEAVPTESL